MRLILGQLDLEPSRGIANFGVVKEQVLSAAPSIDPNDVVVLPELAGGECHSDAYEVAVGRLACELGCHVVGGSHYPPRGDRRVNRGAIADPRGTVTSRYEKQNPYGVEHEQGVSSGSSAGWFECGGRRVAVLLCADFWFSRVFHALPIDPDVVLVASFSVSRKPVPRHSRLLWEHMAVSRAYEFGAFVGISDWAHPVSYAGHPSSGVAGLASPNPPLASDYFQPVASSGFEVFELDFERLDALRDDRESRGFV